MVWNVDSAFRDAASEEAETATLLRDKAEELEKAGNFAQASVYHNAAAKADDRAGVWRGLLH
jgi:hypothetical protein